MKRNRISQLLIVLFLITIAQADEVDFRFAWLTDTHIGSSHASEDLRRAVEDINVQKDIDFIIVSGDITELEIDNHLELAKEILDQLHAPYYIIPGNHDTKWSASGHTKFIQLWKDDKFTFEYEGIRFIGIHQGPLLRMGDGFMARQDLRWLDSVLTDLEDPHQPLFFVTHYGMDPSVSNWYELLNRAKQWNTQAILHGHGHRNKIYDYEGIPGIMGRSTLRRNASSGGYTIAHCSHSIIKFYEKNPGKPLDKPWCELALHWNRKKYAMDKIDRPDFAANVEFPNVTEKWSYQTDFAIASSPAVDRNWVCITNSGGEVITLDIQDGKPLWKFTAAAGIYSTPAIHNNRIVVAAADSSIYCLHKHDGRLIWQYKTNAPIVATPKIDRKTVYVGGSDHTFRALQITDGKIRWQYTEVDGFVETRPLVYDDKVIFGAWDGSLYALQKQTGRLVWKWRGGRPGLLYSPAACWPVAANGHVYITAPDRYWTCIDASDGETIWRTADHMVRETVGISEDGEIVYSRCMMDSVVALSTQSTDPNLLWKVSSDYGYDIDPSMPVEKNGSLFFGTKDGDVYCLNSNNGKLQWKYRAAVGLINTVVPLSRNEVVLSSMDGKVIYLQSTDIQ